MDTLVEICQIIVALGLLNVWLLRFNKPTAYRGGKAVNMPGEFAAYGLPAHGGSRGQGEGTGGGPTARRPTAQEMTA